MPKSPMYSDFVFVEARPFIYPLCQALRVPRASPSIMDSELAWACGETGQDFLQDQPAFPHSHSPGAVGVHHGSGKGMPIPSSEVWLSVRDPGSCII